MLLKKNTIKTVKRSLNELFQNGDTHSQTVFQPICLITPLRTHLFIQILVGGKGEPLLYYV